MKKDVTIMSIIEDNRINGLLAELIAILDFKKNGYKIERTGIGSDFIVFKDGERDNQMYIEVKYNGAELSPLQLKQRRLLKKNGKVYFLYILRGWPQGRWVSRGTREMKRTPRVLRFRRPGPTSDTYNDSIQWLGYSKKTHEILEIGF